MYGERRYRYPSYFTLCYKNREEDTYAVKISVPNISIESIEIPYFQKTPSAGKKADMFSQLFPLPALSPRSSSSPAIPAFLVKQTETI